MKSSWYGNSTSAATHSQARTQGFANNSVDYPCDIENLKYRPAKTSEKALLGAAGASKFLSCSRKTQTSHTDGEDTCANRNGAYC